MNNDQIKAKGRLLITLRGEDGNIKYETEVDNLVTTVGKTLIASRMCGTSSAVINWMAIGTGNASPSVSDTALGGELARVALTTSLSNTTNNINAAALFAAGVGTSTTVREAGLFNAVSSGTLVSRVTFTAIDKLSTDTLNISWTLSIT